MSDTRSTDLPPAAGPHARDGWGAGRIATATVIVLAIVGIAWLAIDLARFFMLVFAAIVLACVFDAMTRRAMRWTRLGRSLSLAISVVVLLLVFISAFVMFGSQLADQIDTIQRSVPEAIEDVENLARQIGFSVSLQDQLRQGASDLSSIVSRAGRYLMAAGSGLADLVLVLVGAIFIAANPAVYRRGFLMLMPERAAPPAEAMLDDAGRGLRGWMIGQAVSSLLVAVLTGGGLALLGVPASGGLGVIAGLLDVIPMIGPIIAGVPAVLLAFTVSPATALWTVLLFLVIQQIQGNFLQPMIQKQAVDVPPAVLLFAVIAFGMIFGTLGVLLSAPLTVVTYVAIQRIYVRTLLGRPIRIAGQDGDDDDERGDTQR